MNHPIIVWCIIAGVLICTFLFRAVEGYCSQCRHRDHRPRHILEIGKDKDIFYLPGDIDEEEDDDFEDL